MTDPIQAAVEKAEETCPCHHLGGQGIWCDAGYGCEHYSADGKLKCLWPGHAAIRSLATVCIGEAAKMVESHSASIASPLAGKVRALLPEKKS